MFLPKTCNAIHGCVWSGICTISFWPFELRRCVKIWQTIKLGGFALDVHASPHLKFQHLSSSICLATSNETQPHGPKCHGNSQHTLTKNSFHLKVWSLLGQAPRSIHPLAVIWGKLWIRLCKLFGKVTPFRLWQIPPRVKLWGWIGKVTPAQAVGCWSQTQPIVKLNKLSGKLTLSRLWPKQNPKVKLVRLLGKIIPSRLWLKSRPNVNLCKQLGRDTRSRLWLKSSPKAKLRRLLGKVTLLRLLLKWQPNAKFCNFFGRSTCSKLWLKLYPNVKLCKPSDEVTRSRLSPKKLSTVKLLQTA